MPLYFRELAGYKYAENSLPPPGLTLEAQTQVSILPAQDL